MAKRIGEVFLEAGMVNEAQINEGLQFSAKWGKRLGISLVELGHLDEAGLVEGLSTFFSVQKVELAPLKIAKTVLQSLSAETVEKYQVLPLRFEGEKLLLATADPSNFEMIQNLEFITGFPVELLVSAPTELKDAIDHYYFGKPRRKLTKMDYKKIESKEKLLETIKACLDKKIISKDELISELLDA